MTTKPSRQRHETPLAKWLRTATQAQRDELAAYAETDVTYLYNLAAGRREPRVGLAARIAAGTRDMHSRCSALPMLSTEDLIVVPGVKA